MKSEGVGSGSDYGNSTTPAVAAGIEEKRWSLERVVEMTETYWQPKLATAKAEKALARRLAEDAVFEKALASL